MVIGLLLILNLISYFSVQIAEAWCWKLPYAKFFKARQFHCFVLFLQVGSLSPSELYHHSYRWEGSRWHCWVRGVPAVHSMASGPFGLVSRVEVHFYFVIDFSGIIWIFLYNSDPDPSKHDGRYLLLVLYKKGRWAPFNIIKILRRISTFTSMTLIFRLFRYGMLPLSFSFLWT